MQNEPPPPPAQCLNRLQDQSEPPTLTLPLGLSLLSVPFRKSGGKPFLFPEIIASEINYLIASRPLLARLPRLIAPRSSPNSLEEVSFFLRRGGRGVTPLAPAAEERRESNTAALGRETTTQFRGRPLGSHIAASGSGTKKPPTAQPRLRRPSHDAAGKLSHRGQCLLGGGSAYWGGGRRNRMEFAGRVANASRG